jgi:hypothetical protein
LGAALQADGENEVRGDGLKHHDGADSDPITRKICYRIVIGGC